MIRVRGRWSNGREWTLEVNLYAIWASVVTIALVWQIARHGW